MGNILNKIKATTGLKQYEGRLNIGILFEGDPKWHNINGSPEALKIVKDIVSKGNTISYNIDQEGNIVDIGLVEKAKIEPIKQTRTNDYKQENDWQDEIVDFATLMDRAHEIGLVTIATEMLSIDLEKKYALFKATVTGKLINDKKAIGVFQAHGDATNENITGAFIKPHFIRMAETRAIVRALRWYTNSAHKAAEEEK